MPSIGPPTASSPETHWGISGCRTDLTSDPHNAFNQLTSSSRSGGGLPTPATAYIFDSNGNLTSETAGTAATTYTWDADNRLRQVTQPGALHSYEYDANGLRTKKVEAGVEARVLLDGPSVLAEYDSANAPARRYLHKPESIDDIHEFTEGGQNYFPLTDALGSVVAITDSVGAVVRRNTYEVYGARSSTGSGPDWAFGFTGREQDASGQRYHRDRYASGATGTWSQADRLGMIPGVNAYLYGIARPTATRDPHGFTASTDSFTAWATVNWTTFLYLFFEASFLALQTADARAECEERRRNPKTYYRGLTVEDVQDLQMRGVIRSNAQRFGLDDIISAFTRSQDPQEAISHSAGRTGVSVFVSATEREAVVRSFAMEPGYSGLFIQFTAVRPPTAGTIPTEHERLFFWQIGGFAGDTLFPPQPAQ